MKGNCRMEWVASTLHTTSEHGVSSITTADAHTSAASSRLNYRPADLWTRQFRRETKSGFCACTITFQLASTPDDGAVRLETCSSFFKIITHYLCVFFGLICINYITKHGMKIVKLKIHVPYFTKMGQEIWKL